MLLEEDGLRAAREPLQLEAGQSAEDNGREDRPAAKSSCARWCSTGPSFKDVVERAIHQGDEDEIPTVTATATEGEKLQQPVHHQDYKNSGLEILDASLPVRFSYNPFLSDDFVIYTTRLVSHKGETMSMPTDLIAGLVHGKPPDSQCCQRDRSCYGCWQCVKGLFAFPPVEGLLKDRVVFDITTAADKLTETQGKQQMSDSATSVSTSSLPARASSSGSLGEAPASLGAGESHYVSRVISKGTWVSDVAFTQIATAMRSIDFFNNFSYVAATFKNARDGLPGNFVFGFCLTWFLLQLEQVITCMVVASDEINRYPNNEDLQLVDLKKKQVDATARQETAPSTGQALRRGASAAVDEDPAAAAARQSEQRAKDKREARARWWLKEQQRFYHFVNYFFQVPTTITDVPTWLHPRGQVGRLMCKVAGARVAVVGNWHSLDHEDCDRKRAQHRTFPSLVIMNTGLLAWQLAQVFANGLSVGAVVYLTTGFKLVLALRKYYQWLQLLRDRCRLRDRIVLRWASALRRRSQEVCIELALHERRNRDVDWQADLVEQIAKFWSSLSDGEEGDEKTVQQALEEIIGSSNSLRRLLPSQQLGKARPALKKAATSPLGKMSTATTSSPSFEWRQVLPKDEKTMGTAPTMLFVSMGMRRDVPVDELHEAIDAEWRKADNVKDKLKNIMEKHVQQGQPCLMQKVSTGRELLFEKLQLKLREPEDLLKGQMPSLKPGDRMPDQPEAKKLQEAMQDMGWRDMTGVYVGMYVPHFAQIKKPLRDTGIFALAELGSSWQRLVVWFLWLLLSVLTFREYTYVSNIIHPVQPTYRVNATLDFHEVLGLLSNAELAVDRQRLAKDLQQLPTELLKDLVTIAERHP